MHGIEVDVEEILHGRMADAHKGDAEKWSFGFFFFKRGCVLFLAFWLFLFGLLAFCLCDFLGGPHVVDFVCWTYVLEGFFWAGLFLFGAGLWDCHPRFCDTREFQHQGGLVFGNPWRVRFAWLVRPKASFLISLWPSFSGLSPTRKLTRFPGVEPSFFSNTNCFPWGSDVFLKRRIPGKNGIGSVPWMFAFLSGW